MRRESSLSRTPPVRSPYFTSVPRHRGVGTSTGPQNTVRWPGLWPPHCERLQFTPTRLPGSDQSIGVAAGDAAGLAMVTTGDAPVAGVAAPATEDAAVGDAAPELADGVDSSSSPPIASSTSVAPSSTVSSTSVAASSTSSTASFVTSSASSSPHAANSRALIAIATRALARLPLRNTREMRIIVVVPSPKS